MLLHLLLPFASSSPLPPLPFTSLCIIHRQPHFYVCPPSHSLILSPLSLFPFSLFSFSDKKPRCHILRFQLNPETLEIAARIPLKTHVTIIEDEIFMEVTDDVILKQVWLWIKSNNSNDDDDASSDNNKNNPCMQRNGWSTAVQLIELLRIAANLPSNYSFIIENNRHCRI